MITVVTMLRGSDPLTLRWAGLYSLMGEGTDLIASVASDFDERESVSLGAKEIHKNQPYKGEDQEGRDLYIADIFNRLVSVVDTEFSILWDDDVVPPTDGIKRLIKRIGDQPKSVVGIVSVYPFTSPGDSINLVFRPFGHAVNKSSVPTDGGLHKVWSGGTGFSIWRTEALKATLPIAPVVTRGTVYGWDRDLATKLATKGLVTLVDSSLVCSHDKLTS